MASDKTIAVRVAVQNVQDAIRALKGLGDQGKEALEQIVSASGRAGNALGQVDGSTNRAAGAMQRFGPQIQQAGYQIGDFAVQVASGQNALVAFGQQGAQLAGFFGPTGAVVGAIIGIAAALGGTLIPRLFETGDAFEGVGDKSEEMAARIAVAAERASQSGQSLRDSVLGGAPQFTGGKLGQPNIDEIEAALAEADRVQSPEVIAAEANRLAGTFGGSRDPEKEKQEQLQILRDIAAARRQNAEEAERDAAQQASQQRQRDEQAARDRKARAERAAADQRQLEEARQKDFYLDLANEVDAFEEAQRAKAKAYDDAFAAAEREADQAQAGVRDDQRREAERAAEEQAEILRRPWEDLVSSVSQLTSGMFEQLLNDGKITAESLGQSFTESINSSIANLGSTLVTQPLQGAVAKLGTGEYGSFGELLAANQNTFAGGVIGGTAGIGAGQVGGQLLGLDGKYSGIGGATGAVAGGIIGSVIPGVGTVIGAGVGGLLGSLAGGLLGGGEDLGNDKSAQVYRAGKGKIVYSDESFSQGNRSITSGILGQVQDLQEALGDLGATFKSPTQYPIG